MEKKIVENYEDLPDDRIITMINDRNPELIGVIIKRYYPTILMYTNSFCPSEMREDAIQEATFALYSAVKSYDSQKSSFATFADICIKRSVISFCKTHFRKKHIPSDLLSPIDQVEIPDSNSPEKIFFDRNDYEALTDSIKLELSAMEYKVLQLYLCGYRYSVIADKLGIKEKAVDNALLRIRRKLKQQ